LEEMMAYQAVHDSIFKLERSKQVEELQTQYETEKKDAEIRDLTQTNELNRWRIWALLLGLIALAAFAYLIVQKRKKDRLLFETEQALEKEKSQKAQVELEYKQKELTAKVLQLAHKNEFLNTVETQLEKLKVNVDSDVSRTGNRISRLIKRDIEGDAQWEQFAQEFTRIHQGFLSRLAEKYGVFSKSEVRLISLLKMNMTSKEIADIMGISDSGVKKARYRLRKKMNLEDSELQGFLLSFA